MNDFLLEIRFSSASFRDAWEEYYQEHNYQVSTEDSNTGSYYSVLLHLDSTDRRQRVEENFMDAVGGTRVDSGTHTDGRIVLEHNLPEE